MIFIDFFIRFTVTNYCCVLLTRKTSTKQQAHNLNAQIMKTKFSWNTKSIQKVISIENGEATLGNLTFYKDNLSAKADLLNCCYDIKTRSGHFSRYIDIYNKDNKQAVATICSSHWTTRATITHQGKGHTFRYNNIFCKEWRLTHADGSTVIDYKRLKQGGEIETSEENNLLLICGLYLGNKNFSDTSYSTLAIAILVMYSIIF